jgi:hypothetical protein
MNSLAYIDYFTFSTLVLIFYGILILALQYWAFKAVASFFNMVFRLKKSGHSNWYGYEDF